jgi:hypothetical protein
MQPFRVQLLDAQNGWCVYDHVWSWPVDTQAEGVAALVQSTRQLARELGAGEVLRMLVEIPVTTLASPLTPPTRQASHGSVASASNMSVGGLASPTPIRIVLMESLLVSHWNVVGVLFYDYADTKADPHAADAQYGKFLTAVATIFLQKFGDALDPAIGAASASRDNATIIAKFRESCATDDSFTARVLRLAESCHDIEDVLASLPSPGSSSDGVRRALSEQGNGKAISKSSSEASARSILNPARPALDAS